jgi:hypothetical protein
MGKSTANVAAGSFVLCAATEGGKQAVAIVGGRAGERPVGQGGGGEGHYMARSSLSLLKKQVV